MGSKPAAGSTGAVAKVIRQFPRQALEEGDDFADVLVAQILAELRFRRELCLDPKGGVIDDASIGSTQSLPVEDFS
jgi:hypothetical protein